MTEVKNITRFGSNNIKVLVTDFSVGVFNVAYLPDNGYGNVGTDPDCILTIGDNVSVIPTYPIKETETGYSYTVAGAASLKCAEECKNSNNCPAFKAWLKFMGPTISLNEYFMRNNRFN